MTDEANTLIGLERQRLELEDNVRKLQQSLYDWRLWEAEYDGLKEEIAALEKDSTRDEIFEASREMSGAVVDEKEIRVLLGEGQTVTRSRDQVVQQITRRLDYVKQNVAVLEKRLEAAEADLDKLLAIERPFIGEEHAVTEIFEQLDEDGTVIASSTSTPGDRAPELLEVLKNAGVEDIPDVRAVDKKKIVEEEETPSPAKQNLPPAKFTKTGQFENGQSTKNDDRIIQDARLSDTLEEEDENTRPVTEIDESAEDAELRREMLRYSFNEVGAIVAELELDEEGSEFSVEDDYEYEEGEDEEEDEYGRTTRKVLDEEYHQQMRELEERLNAQGLTNIGPDPSSLPEEVRRELEAPVSVKIEKGDNQSILRIEPKKDKTKRKKVAFAEEIDIAPESTTAATMTDQKAERVQPEIAPISESIVERSKSNKPTEETVTAPRKASRFKSARSTGAQMAGDLTSPVLLGPQNSIKTYGSSQSTTSPIPLFPAKSRDPKPFSQPIVAGDSIIEKTSRAEPQPPEGKTLSDSLVERPVSDKYSAVPPDPDEIDEEIHRKEIATEFYRMRNHIIQKNGGFLKDEEQEELIDEEEVPPKRVSKFKAARLH